MEEKIESEKIYLSVAVMLCIVIMAGFILVSIKGGPTGRVVSDLGLKIGTVTPEDGSTITAESFIIEVRTNKIAKCSYFVENAIGNIVVEGPLYGKMMYFEKVNTDKFLNQQDYKLTVKCVDTASNEKESSVSFKLDNSGNVGSTKSMKNKLRIAADRIKGNINVDTGVCVLVPFEDTKYSFSVTMEQGVVSVVNADKLYCKGSEEEDFIIEFVSTEAFEGLAAKPSRDKFIEGRKGKLYHVLISKFVPQNKKFLCSQEFQDKFCDAIKKDSSGFDITYLGCCGLKSIVGKSFAIVPEETTEEVVEDVPELITHEETVEDSSEEVSEGEDVLESTEALDGELAPAAEGGEEAEEDTAEGEVTEEKYSELKTAEDKSSESQAELETTEDETAEDTAEEVAVAEGAAEEPAEEAAEEVTEETTEEERRPAIEQPLPPEIEAANKGLVGLLLYIGGFAAIACAGVLLFVFHKKKGEFSAKGQEELKKQQAVQDLMKYMRAQFDAGYKRDQIMKVQTQQGWDRKTLEEIFNHVFLEDLIQTYVKKGYKKIQITPTLVRYGWTHKQIDEALQKLKVK